MYENNCPLLHRPIPQNTKPKYRGQTLEYLKLNVERHVSKCQCRKFIRFRMYTNLYFKYAIYKN